LKEEIKEESPIEKIEVSKFKYFRLMMGGFFKTMGLFFLVTFIASPAIFGIFYLIHMIGIPYEMSWPTAFSAGSFSGLMTGIAYNKQYKEDIDKKYSRKK
jgi:hypothetical protein